MAADSEEAFVYIQQLLDQQTLVVFVTLTEEESMICRFRVFLLQLNSKSSTYTIRHDPFELFNDNLDNQPTSIAVSGNMLVNSSPTEELYRVARIDAALGIHIEFERRWRGNKSPTFRSCTKYQDAIWMFDESGSNEEKNFVGLNNLSSIFCIDLRADLHDTYPVEFTESMQALIHFDETIQDAVYVRPKLMMLTDEASLT